MHHLGAEDVRGKQVGGELDAADVHREHSGEGLGEGGLADARDVFDQDVATRDETEQKELDDVVLTLDDPR